MKIKEAIIGSGISSFIYQKNSLKKFKIFSSNNYKVLKSHNFYELDAIGGNSNIWGGYINNTRHKKFLKNVKYKKFFKKNLFSVNKVFSEQSGFSKTYYLADKDNNVFRVKKEMFGNKIIENPVEKIIISKEKLSLISKNKSFKTDKIALCVGNLNLIKLMHNSDWIKDEDIVSFDDGKCLYSLNLLIDKKNNHYIPMPLIKILEKVIFRKSLNYSKTGQNLILQKFPKTSKNYSITCSSLLKMNNKKIRFFLSNHIANLRINNIPVRKFINQKSNRISVFCSGAIKKYVAGPVIQDLIFDITSNQ
jgi:hypothetical protein